MCTYVLPWAVGSELGCVCVRIRVCTCGACVNTGVSVDTLGVSVRVSVRSGSLGTTCVWVYV